MNPENQRTVGRVVSIEGVGLHSGEASTLTIRPAPVDAGISFRRVDLDGAPVIPADIDHVADTELSTTLGEGELRVLTVEHAMAALAASRIDNAILDITASELPICDGSFGDYTDALDDAGSEEQDSPARVICVSEPLSVSVKEGASYNAVPASDYRLSVTIDFDHPAIGRQHGSYEVSPEAFREDLARARTFGFRQDAEALHARGLALGSSLENTVVLDRDSVLNDDLRYPDEFLRHKAGDIIGDLALLGARFQGHIISERPSHRGNLELARKLRAQVSREKNEGVVDIERIMEYLPHRYPMLLIDRILEFEPEKRIVGLKNVTINEPFFQGHFPGHPIMPGVLLVEAMAQVGGLLLMEKEGEGKVVYFMAMDKVKFRKPVVPGDQVLFELTLVQYRRSGCKIRGVGRVNGKVVVEGNLLARVMDL